MPHSGYSTTTKSQIIHGAGLIVVGVGPAPFGVTTGGVRSTLTEEFRNPAFDGQTADIADADRIVGWEGIIVATFKEMSAARLQLLRPGSTANVVGSVTTVRRPNANTNLASGSYVRAVYPLGNGDLAIVRFDKFRATWTQLSGENRGEGTYEVTFRAQQAFNGTTITTDSCPWVEEFVASPGSGVQATIPTIP